MHRHHNKYTHIPNKNNRDMLIYFGKGIYFLTHKKGKAIGAAEKSQID